MFAGQWKVSQKLEPSSVPNAMYRKLNTKHIIVLYTRFASAVQFQQHPNAGLGEELTGPFPSPPPFIDIFGSVILIFF